MKKINSKQGYRRCPITAGSPAQGAIEYLLIIGAAVIIAVIVIALMMSLSATGTQSVADADVADIYRDLKIVAKGYEIEIELGSWSYGPTTGNHEPTIAVATDPGYIQKGSTYNFYEFPLHGGDKCRLESYTSLDGNVANCGAITCFNTPLEARIIIDSGKESEEIHLVNVSSANVFAGEKITFKHSFKGSPDEPHTISITYDDCWSGSNQATRGCCGNSDFSITGSFDKNLKVYSINIKNAKGEATNLTSPSGTFGVCTSTPCISGTFQ